MGVQLKKLYSEIVLSMKSVDESKARSSLAEPRAFTGYVNAILFDCYVTACIA